MSDEEDRLRGMLSARAGRVHSHLSGPAIRARARSRGVVRRYAPLVSAVAVLSILVVLGLVLFHRGDSPTAPVPPAATVTTTLSTQPAATTTPAPTPSTTVSPSATPHH